MKKWATSTNRIGVCGHKWGIHLPWVWLQCIKYKCQFLRAKPARKVENKEDMVMITGFMERVVVVVRIILVFSLSKNSTFFASSNWNPSSPCQSRFQWTRESSIVNSYLIKIWALPPFRHHRRPSPVRIQTQRCVAALLKTKIWIRRPLFLTNSLSSAQLHYIITLWISIYLQTIDLDALHTKLVIMVHFCIFRQLKHFCTNVTILISDK